MTDIDIADAGIRVAIAEGREIDDLTARIIANQFYDGSSRALAFVSTGTIDDIGTDALWHVFGASYRTYPMRERRLLDWLGTYMLHAGVRGPIEGWENLTW